MPVRYTPCTPFRDSGGKEAWHCHTNPNQMDGGRLASIFEWAQITMGSCGEELPVRFSVCNPNQITEDMKGSWADGAAQEMCPILAGQQHSEEDDCRCAQALRDHGDGLQEFGTMNCLMPVEGGGLLHLLNDWPQEILAKCYEGMCSEEAVYEASKDLAFFPRLADACPSINLDSSPGGDSSSPGDEETDDCQCAAMLRMLDSEVRPIEAFDCWFPTKHGDRMTLLDGWVPETLEKCNSRCDLPTLKNELMAFESFGPEIIDQCPVLDGQAMDDPQSCECAKATNSNKDQLRENTNFDCYVEYDGDLVKLLDEWAPRTEDERCHHEFYMCSAEEIAEATRPFPFYGEIEAACPTLRGEEHTEESDCGCAQAVSRHFGDLEEIPQWQCHMEIDGRMVHLLHNWTWETLEHKCGPAVPEKTCDVGEITDSIRHFDFYMELEMACPALRGDEHDGEEHDGEEHDCDCGRTVQRYMHELEAIPAMHCFLEGGEENDSISLLGEWVPRALKRCGECRDDPEGFVAADPHKDCSMVHDWWSCDSFDHDFNGVARWVWELCPMSCGKCHDEPHPIGPYHPEPEHEASKCTEWGSFDNDCCAEHKATTCADGFIPKLSDVTCDPTNPERFPGSEGVFFYSCVPNHGGGPATPPTGEQWWPAAGHDASKCREWGGFDDDCCAEHAATTCADGYEPIMSGSTCDPQNPAPAGVWRYSCVPPHP